MTTAPQAETMVHSFIEVGKECAEEVEPDQGTEGLEHRSNRLEKFTLGGKAASAADLSNA